MLSAGSLSGTGALTVNGMLTWMAGTMSGSGATVIPSGATLSVSGTDTYLAQRTINNAGTISWSGGELCSGVGRTSDEQGSGVEDLQADTRVSGRLGGVGLV